MSSRLRVFIFAAVVFGLAAGIFAGRAPNAQATTYQYDIWNQPGGSGSLSCGWHTICAGTANNGPALDWGGLADVYFRSWSNNSAGATAAGQGRITWLTSGQGQCNHTYVDIWDGNAYLGELHYQHVVSGYSGYNFWVSSGYYPSWTEYYFGVTASEPDNPCATSGYHVHQEWTSGSWVKNPNYLTMADCSLNCGSYDVTSTANYQIRLTWYK